jgi:hypothetical protein
MSEDPISGPQYSRTLYQHPQDLPLKSLVATQQSSIDPVEQEIFKEKIWIYKKIESSIETTMKSLYDLRSRLRDYDDYTAYSTSADSMALLKAVGTKMTGFRNKQYLPHALHKIMSESCGLEQGKHRSNQQYNDKFNSLVNTAEDSGATIAITLPESTKCYPH